MVCKKVRPSVREQPRLELEYHDLLSLFEFLDNGDGEITHPGKKKKKKSAAFLSFCMLRACGRGHSLRSRRWIDRRG